MVQMFQNLVGWDRSKNAQKKGDDLFPCVVFGLSSVKAKNLGAVITETLKLVVHLQSHPVADPISFEFVKAHVYKRQNDYYVSIFALMDDDDQRDRIDQEVALYKSDGNFDSSLEVEIAMSVDSLVTWFKKEAFFDPDEKLMCVMHDIKRNGKYTNLTRQ